MLENIQIYAVNVKFQSKCTKYISDLSPRYTAKHHHKIMII